jgi:hypothetical protein
MSATRQRRRMIALAVAALAVGLIAGLLIGRATASDVSDAVNASKDRGRALAAALRTLPLEYEQARSGSGENQAGIEDTVKRVSDQAATAIAKAPWLGPTDRATVTSAMQAVVDAVRRKASTDEFQRTVEAAASVVEDVFAVSR